MNLKKGVGRFLKYGTLISSFCFIAVTLIQIYARFFMDSAPSWTEEAARFFFIYAMSFAAGLAMKGGYYVHFDVIYNKMSIRQQNILSIIVSLFTIVLFLILTVYAIQFVKVGIIEHSPSLGVSMAIAFASMVIMGAFITVYAIWDLLKSIKKLKH
ncbi:TRAP transporter small permease [Algibacter agarivorans]|uniref:TRAP transporter small permease n=1 Tax=Algibacter agarivorans TaxID=1109741 RepID=A0ABP9GVA3_9FLAO